MAMLPVADALRLILDQAAPLGAETVPLMDARGRVLADDVTALLNQPPFDASAMDGYAVRAADVETLPATLTLIGEAAAGRGFGGRVGPGEAARIFTGAPLPEGADAIVIQENVEALGRTVVVREGMPDGAHIRPRGGDFPSGAVVLRAGRRLDARALTLAAASGHAALRVHRRPVVAILATGNELVPPGVVPGPDQIVSSNPVGIAAIVEAAGGVARLIGIARDDRESLSHSIAAAQDADVLVTIGGASVGDHDLVAPALEAAGVTLGFWKIAMRPGKPMLFGQRAGQRVLGLPGNPVSSLICGRVFLMPLVARLAGREADAAGAVTARLAAPIEPNGPRQHYMRATLETAGDGGVRVRPARSQDSSLLMPLAAADALIVRPPHAPALLPGDAVSILPLDF